VVVTAGPWVKSLLIPLGIRLPLEATLEQVAYLQLQSDSDEIPIIRDWTPEAMLGHDHWTWPSEIRFALPNPEEPGSIKAGLSREGPVVNPDNRRFDPDDEGVLRLEAWVDERFRPVVEVRPPQTCLTTFSPDGDFVIDRIGSIVIGSACSGHGFKFTPLLGKIYADLATGTPVKYPLQAFSARRQWPTKKGSGKRRTISERSFTESESRGPGNSQRSVP
jgi:sarcosine oxidase